MNWDQKMIKGKTLVHVDIDPTVIGRTWNSDVPLVGDCAAVLQALLNSNSRLRCAPGFLRTLLGGSKTKDLYFGDQLGPHGVGNPCLRAHKMGKGPAELTELVQHDWVGFAKSLGLEAERVTKPEDLGPAFAKALGSGKAYLLDIRCDKVFTTPVNPYSQAKKEWIDDD